MPTYEYECSKCGHEFELFQSITAPHRKRCPECRGAVKRLLGTGSGIIFKGSGFYQTDYRSDSYKKGAKAESGKASESKGSTTSKSSEKSKSSSSSSTAAPKKS